MKLGRVSADSQEKEAMERRGKALYFTNKECEEFRRYKVKPVMSLTEAAHLAINHLNISEETAGHGSEMAQSDDPIESWTGKQLLHDAAYRLMLADRIAHRIPDVMEDVRLQVAPRYELKNQN